MGKLKIELLGETFSIQANENEEYLEKLLDYYRQITKDVEQIDSVNSPLQIAILSGIMLVDELYKEKQQNIDFLNGDFSLNKTENELNQELTQIKQKTNQLIDKISKVLN